MNKSKHNQAKQNTTKQNKHNKTNKTKQNTIKTKQNTTKQTSHELTRVVAFLPSELGTSQSRQAAEGGFDLFLWALLLVAVGGSMTMFLGCCERMICWFWGKEGTKYLLWGRKTSYKWGYKCYKVGLFHSSYPFIRPFIGDTKMNRF